MSDSARAQASAQTILPRGVRQVATMAGVTEYLYPNGLRVLLLPDAGSSTVTVNVTVLVGSRHEGYGETGMAHLLEHMNFISSTHNRNIKKELQDHGARWNGTTYYDRTNYFETVNASTENLAWALTLEAERLVNMRIDKSLLDTEMTVVRNEFERGENSIERVLGERVLSTAFLWHNYGKSTIGSRADIERVPIDRLAAFYKKYYQPDNAVVTVAGAIDAFRTLGMIATTLGAIPKPTRVLDATYTTEPAQDGERFVELRRVGRGKNLIIAYHSPALAHPDAAALEVLSGVLAARGGTGRLDKALIETRKAVSVSVDVEELHDPAFVMLSATLSDEQSLDEVKTIVYDTLAGILSSPPTQEEVDRSRTRILQAEDRTIADSRAIAMQLNESIAAGDWRLFFTNYEAIRRTTSDDVVRVAKTYLKASNRTVGVFIPDAAPDRTSVPASPTVETLLSTYTPDITVDSGEALDPSPAALESHIRRSTLPGGLRMALVQKRTRGGRVQASLTLRFGDETSLAGQAAVAQMTEALLMRGTTKHTRQQLQDEMQRLNATINVGRGDALGAVSASISTTDANLPAALKLAVEVLREPAFPEADFESIRGQQIAQIERGRTDPGRLVQVELQRLLSNYPRSDVRHVRTIDEEIEDLKAVTLADVRRFHDRFYGASHGEFIVVGAFDPSALTTAANESLGSWTNAVPFARIVNTYQEVAPANQKIETPDKENAQFSAGIRLRLRDADPDYAALVMANYMLGGGGLSARIPDRIRNREGLSYGVNTNFAAPVEGDAAIFSMAAIANPTNTPKVETSFIDELNKTRRDGFTAAELASAKKSLMDTRTGGRSSDAGLLGLIEAREQWGRTLEWDAKLDAALNALTLEQANAALRKSIDPSKLVIVKGGDFKAAKVYQ